MSLYGMTLYITNKTVHLPQYKGAEMDLYLMEPLNGDMKLRYMERMEILSKQFNLNYAEYE